MLSYINPYPPDSGGQKQAFDELRILASLGEVDLLTFYEETLSEIPLLLKEHLSPYYRALQCVPIKMLYGRHRLKQIVQFFRSLFSPYPFRLQKFWVPEMQSIFSYFVKNNIYDIILFNHLALVRYSTLIPPDYPAVKILTEANIEWEIFERHAQNAKNPLKKLLASYEARRLRQAEIAWANRFDGIHALSERDRDILQTHGVKRPVHIFRRPMQVLDPPITTYETSEPWVISLGRLDETRTPGTLWFAEKVWDQVRARCPEAQWHIIGADPPPSVQALHGSRNITVHGYVRDLEPILRKTRVCIIPLFIGGGIRIKILDMLSQGIPCVSTSVGAQGLENEGVLIADEPKAFAEAVVRILTEPGLWGYAQMKGQEFIRNHYGYERAIAEEKKFITSLMKYRNSR